MKGKVPVRRLPTTLASVAVVGILGMSACGSETKSASGTTTASASTPAPEDIRVDAATVTAGLRKLPATIASAIAAIGTPDAKAKLAEIETEWASFEGTVRNTDATLYLAIEDQLTPLQRQIGAGDSSTATTTAATMSGLFDQYMAKYP
jgi:hypothetical protein